MKSPAIDDAVKSRDTGLGVSDLRVAAVLVFVILNLAVFLLRVISIWRYGALFPTRSLTA